MSSLRGPLDHEVLRGGQVVRLRPGGGECHDRQSTDRSVVAFCGCPAPQILAAVVAAFVVTQLAIFTTTVYPAPGAHAPGAHRAPDRRVPVPVRDLDHDRHAPARVGRGAPQAPRRDRHAEDPHSPMVVGFWRVQLGNVGLYKRAARDDEMVRKYARDIPTDRLDRLAFDYSLVGLGHRHRDPRGRDVGARLRAAHRLRRGRAARGALRDARRRDQRGRPPVRQAAVRELGDEPAAARARHRRRGAAQQPSRRAHVGAVLAAPRRDRSRLVGRARARRRCTSRTCATTTCTSSRPRSNADGRVTSRCCGASTSAARTRSRWPTSQALFVGLGHTDVVTYIQSGNVVFKSPIEERGRARACDRGADRARPRSRRRGAGAHEGRAGEGRARAIRS